MQLLNALWRGGPGFPMGVRFDEAPLKDRDPGMRGVAALFPHEVAHQHTRESSRALAPEAGTPDTEQVRIPPHVLPIRTEPEAN